uniref:Uncharacterized protein n=1 Tax=Clandestinovirus TaxID=2831644 RepID=A0A8F8PN15_9VIRU|nr:hypothetical protein KOM_12_112 [Clandestinovirus]
MFTSSQASTFPNQIRVKGLPFMLQGWNNVYYKTNEISDGKPVYRLNPYTLYYTIPIIGVTIRKVDGVWVLQRDCDDSPLMNLNKYGGQDDPFGFWSQGMKVEPVCN